MKILLAVDGSVLSRHMLAVLGARDDLLPGRHEYTAITVVEPLAAQVAAFTPAASIARRYDDDAQAVLEPIRRFAKQQGWKLHTRHAVGGAGEQIVRCAAEGGFDLIVMGTHGRTALADVLMGSATTHVLSHCRIPVLLIPRPAAEWTALSPAGFTPASEPSG